METSASRAKLIDAAVQLILEEGYAAVTARRVAAKARLKPQLVHYYFPTMDDLLVAVIRRGGDANLERMARALMRGQPLQVVWRLSSDVRTATLSMQFLALATHRKALRAEVKRYAEQLRAMQTDALTRYYEALGIAPGAPPIAAMLAITSISQLLQLERALDISLGHDETKAYIKRHLADLQVCDQTLAKKTEAQAPLKAATDRTRRK